MTPAQQWQYATGKLTAYRDTGALERRSPLPVGTYWIDQVGEENIKLFEDWKVRNGAIVGFLSIEQTDDDPRAFWYLFKVTGGPEGKFLPQWDGPGLPNIAEPGISKSSDTVSSPDKMGVIEFFAGSEVAKNLDTYLETTFGNAKRIAILAGVAGVGYIGYRVAVKQGWL